MFGSIVIEYKQGNKIICTFLSSFYDGRLWSVVKLVWSEFVFKIFILKM